MTSSESDESFRAGFGIGTVLGIVGTTILLGVTLGIAGSNSISSFKEEAIKRNVAAYNSKTGEWQWTVEPTNEQVSRP
jgi:hypothetical protein